MKPTRTSDGATTLDIYLAEISRYPILSAEEEQELSRRFLETRDTRAAHRLVAANLRFVVKVASEYRSYGFRLADLVQEGNLGLMRAVQKFDPDKGIRLISYAVWWIRAYIQNHILRSWSLVKLGTTQAQRKLFFSLGRARRELDRSFPGRGGDSPGRNADELARRLGVKASEVREMELRLEGRDLSLDAPVGDDGSATRADFVPSGDAVQDEALSDAEERSVASARIGAALRHLDPRERFIVERRVMSDRPMTLKEVGEHFGFSRERARQLEIRAKEKLRERLRDLAAEIDWPTGGAPVEIDDSASPGPG